ncbi:phage holin family protein [Flavobacterium sp.]|uniref:phage holin family protein n=1 Tax=Flavobacterium sp. TaxID=239 RepID=UPI002622D15C|nr:phage holin family protein [Flavobacterium sp.]
MKYILRLLLTAVLVLLLSKLPGIHVQDFRTALTVALVLWLLNLFVKPILVLFTLPVTLLTLGLFLLVINALIIMLCSRLFHVYNLGNFHVDGFLDAFIFSILLSICQSVLFRMTEEKDNKR